jgi:hypothetical protein
LYRETLMLGRRQHPIAAEQEHSKFLCPRWAQ